MSKGNEESKIENDEKKDNIEDELEKQWEMQNQIQKVCKMKANAEERQKKWKDKYG